MIEIDIKIEREHQGEAKQAIFLASNTEYWVVTKDSLNAYSKVFEKLPRKKKKKYNKTKASKA